MWDQDEDAVITLVDMQKVVQETGESISNDRLKAMLQAIDRDNDQQISMQEYIAVFRE